MFCDPYTGPAVVLGVIDQELFLRAGLRSVVTALHVRVRTCPHDLGRVGIIGQRIALLSLRICIIMF